MQFAGLCKNLSRLTKKYLKLNLKKDHEQQPMVFSNKLTVKYKKKKKYEDFKILKLNNKF